MDASGFSPEIQSRINALPEDVRKLVYSTDMDAIVQEIGRKHALHIDQLEALEAEAAAAMIGMTDPAELTENITDALNLDQQKGMSVAKDVNDMLFAKIRESMKKIYSAEEKKAEPAAPGPAAVTAPPMAASTMQKSVVMPSIQTPQTKLAVSVMPPKPGMPSAPMTPSSAPKPPAPPLQNSAPKPPMPPAKAPDLHPAEVVMNQKTIQTPPPQKPPVPSASPAVGAPQPPTKGEPPKPGAYKADPYREPIE